MQDPGTKPDYKLLPYQYFEAIAANPDHRFDAVVVDEWQDFEPLWLEALQASLRDPDEGLFYVFRDSHQLLYRQEGELPDFLSRTPRYPLNHNIRNTRSIFDLVARHYQGPERLQPRGPQGQAVEVETYEGTAGLQRVLGKMLQRLLIAERIDNRDIVVLTPRSLERSHLRHLHLPGDITLVEKDPAPRSRQVLASSVYKFKGLESRVAVVAELDGDMRRSPEERPRICYVAFSRPRTHLVLLGTPDTVTQLLPEER